MQRAGPSFIRRSAKHTPHCGHAARGRGHRRLSPSKESAMLTSQSSRRSKHPMHVIRPKHPPGATIELLEGRVLLTFNAYISGLGAGVELVDNKLERKKRHRSNYLSFLPSPFGRPRQRIGPVPLFLLSVIPLPCGSRRLVGP